MPAAPPLDTGQCLFLDLDGTLLHLREDPVIVRADPVLIAQLADLGARLGGALAIVSGRPIGDLDVCFEPVRFAAAGIHGLERRGTRGLAASPRGDDARLRAAARKLGEAMEAFPLSHLEDKGASLALHWRREPAHRGALRALAERALAELGPAYRLLEGDAVVELLPREADKGAAVRAFLGEAPFNGRQPVFVGDDVTDLTGFAAAREAGGYGIAVGDRVAAEYRLDGVDAVRRWLAGDAGD